jgi:hypothetical protein
MDNSCVLIGNKFAFYLQIIVFFSSISVLFLHKIFIENNFKNIYQASIKYLYSKICKKNIYFDDRRTWKLWFMDNIKQGLSSLCGHFWAIFIAITLSNNENTQYQCGWFLIQFLIDTIIGIGLSFLFSILTIKLLKMCFPNFTNQYLTIGYYNSGSNSYSVWKIQTFHWLFVSITARMFCSLLIYFSNNIWISSLVWFDNIWNNKKEELLFVVLILPIKLNSMQYLLQNKFLRWTKSKRNDKLRIPILDTNY